MTKNQKIIFIGYVAIALLIFPAYLGMSNLRVEGVWQAEDLDPYSIVICDGHMLRHGGSRPHFVKGTFARIGEYSADDRRYQLTFLDATEGQSKSTLMWRELSGITIDAHDGMPPTKLTRNKTADKKTMMAMARNFIAELESKPQSDDDGNAIHEPEKHTANGLSNTDGAQDGASE